MNSKQFDLYLERANKFFATLENKLFLDTETFRAEILTSPEPIAFENRLKHRYRPIATGEKWGNLWDSAWLHLTGEIPDSWAGSDIWCKLNFGGESLIFDAQGVPVYGLTYRCVFDNNFRKDLYPLFTPCRGGQKIDLWLEVAANGLQGAETDMVRPDLPLGIIHYMKFGRFDSSAWKLMNDFEVLWDLLKDLPAGQRRAVQLIHALNKAIDIYADDAANTVAADQVLAHELEFPATQSALTTIAVGHAHIDTGWLWPVRETIRKCARTYASQLYNMARYPGYVFGASAAQHYDFIKRYYPKLYEKIKVQIQAGRWEVQGGMWVEPDCNLISGESMVRQFLHGKNFFRSEFGVDVRNLWLPDVFGYSAALPQIMKKSGCDYFVTQKISWSQYNKFPYHTFVWEGIDHSAVITHFPPEDTYNSWLLPHGLRYAENNFNENAILPEFLSLFGMGDGGGGPKFEHLEHGVRTANMESVPRVKFGRADEFLSRLEPYKKQLPKWVGELYLELHRGTLTTQARTKCNNRYCEQKLTAVEFLCSCLPLEQYPQNELKQLWQVVLLNQFHDILPGSSIREVYETTEKEHAEVLTRCDELIDQAAKKLLKPVSDTLTVFNSLSYFYQRPVKLPPEWCNCSVTDASGRELATQQEEGNCWILGNFPPQSFTVWHRGAPTAQITPPRPQASELVLENSLVRYEFSPQGELLSAWDKELQQEFISHDAGNVFKLYVDIPHNWDAWEIDQPYENTSPERARLCSVQWESAGSVRQVLKFKFAVGKKSTIEQKVVLTPNSRRLEFDTQVDWHEQHRMLRVSFGTTIAAAEATFDIQYGYLKRPVHRNTSWDSARFEVMGQRYVDLSDRRSGVALLNDCKYGHKVLDGVIELNLLRSPTQPDPLADQGQHRFTYALLPHGGELPESEVMAEAAALNRQPLVLPGQAEQLACPAQIKENNGVNLEVLKRAFNESAWIIRLVETLGNYSSATVQLTSGSALEETNLVEWERGEVFPAADGQLKLKFKPFEIRTFKIVQ